MVKENSKNNKGSSTVLNLESLNREYKNLLIEYKQAVSNYVNYIKQEIVQPCATYNADSKGISQECYNDIWKKAGCGTGTIQPGPNVNNSWAQSQTLNGLIQDSWLWATLTDNDHRNGCYGQDNKNYNTSTSPDYNINKPIMSSINGAAFWGTSGLSQSKTNTVEECQALCSNTSGCSGATYNQTTSLCSLRKGDANIVAGGSTDYSIVPKSKSLLKIVQSINEKLTQVNEKIQELSQTVETQFNSEAEQRSSSNTNLIDQYKNLVGERDKIQQMLNEYQTLDKQQLQGNIHISQNYYSFILLMFLAILVIILLYKFSIPSAQSSTTFVENGGELGTTAYYIVFGLFLLVLLFTLYNKYANLITYSNMVYVSSVFTVSPGAWFSSRWS